MSLDSRYLRSFIALCEELHFGRTAERLGIAQSVLSGQLKRIEDVIDARLIERGRRASISLTDAGKTFLVEARAAIAQLDRAERIGRLAGRSAAGSATLGYVFSAAMSGVLARTLAAVRERLPDISLAAAPIETPEQISALAEARLDVGLLRPNAPCPPDVSAQVVHSEPLLLAMSSAHPLASQRSVMAAELASEAFIIPQVSSSMGLSRAVTDLARVGRFSVRLFLDTGDFMTAANLAVARYGIVLAPRSLSNLCIEGLCYREINDYSGSVDLALAWRGAETPLVRTIINALANADPDSGHPQR